MKNNPIIWSGIGIIIMLCLIATVWFMFSVPISENPAVFNIGPNPHPRTPSTSSEGVPDSWNTFTDKNDGFAVSYPPEFNLKSESIYLNDQNATGTEIDYPATYTTGTNLGEAYVGITKKTVTSTDACYAPFGYTTSTSDVVINGVKYRYSNESDAGAGNLYDTVRYATIKGDTCYNVALLMHSTQRMNYPPELRPAAFDRAAVTSVFEKIMKTFRML